MSDDDESLMEEAVNQLAEDGKDIAGAIVSGKNPVTAVAQTIVVEDGRISIKKIKQHKWTAMLFLFGTIFGFIITDPGASYALIINHVFAFVISITTFIAGYVVRWMFEAEPEE